jgi:LacI family transcriptional regulator
MKKVALLIPLSRAFGRGITRGVLNYANNIGHWQIFSLLPDYTSSSKVSVAELIKKWQPDGIVAHIPFLDINAYRDFGIPMVAANIYSPIKNAANIVPDCDTPLKMAADYFVSKGFRHFAFCGFHMHWCMARERSFRHYVHGYGYNVDVYQTPKQNMRMSWETEQPYLAEWLLHLPRPIAVLATNDDRARHVLEACQLAGLDVPGDVAVLGSDNDAMVCEMTSPPLSSIAYNFENSGYEAAEVLDCMMRTVNCSKHTVVTQAQEIVTRQSTDIMAIEDADVAKAVQFIQTHFKTNISVMDVVEATTLSRRSLESRFGHIVRHSIAEEIRRQRIAHAVKLLVGTNLTVAQIASAAGFHETKRLNEVFIKYHKISPSSYRSQHARLFLK